MNDKVRLIDAELLTTNIAQIARVCARSDAQMALVGRILFMIDNMSTVESITEGYLSDWYIASVSEDDTPVWTEEHIGEVCRDFYLIPKGV